MFKTDAITNAKTKLLFKLPTDQLDLTSNTYSVKQLANQLRPLCVVAGNGHKTRQVDQLVISCQRWGYNLY